MKQSIQDKIDTYIAYAVGLQSFLAILQYMLLGLFHFDDASATTFRIVAVACLMGPAIILSAHRKPVLFLMTYVIVSVILSLTILLFPANQEFIINEAFRFLLPISIPSCLCLIAIRNYGVIEQALYKISIATSLLVFIYCLGLFSGVIGFEGYSMGFGYACLLPMAMLYHHRSRLSKLASLFLLAAVIAIGSRGPAMTFVLYVILDISIYDRKQIPYLIGISIIVGLALPLFFYRLESIGINSRTIYLLMEGDTISHTSGRDEIYKLVLHEIFGNPFGHGLYGDRVFLNGTYCHNFFLELFFDLGIIVGGIVSLCLIGWIAHVFLESNTPNRRIILLVTIITFVPLMVSGSFLKDFNIGLLMGILFRLRVLNYKNKPNIICKPSRSA